jgi:glutathione-regulated potassium-efflux system ancillary protein KefG
MGEGSQKPTILVIVAHPALEESRANRFMTDAIRDIPNARIHSLYKEYPDFKINVAKEQKLALSADVIVFQFPLYWYSSPALLKEWQDRVLELGFAYGNGGDKLKDKTFFMAVTTGGPELSYQEGGYNKYSVSELLKPIEQTAIACQMKSQPPFVVHHVHKLSDEELRRQAQRYRQLLEEMVQLYVCS